MHILRENQRLESIWWPEDGSININDNGVEYIIVRMQPGQMGMVPWAEVGLAGGEIGLYNLAHCEGVKLLRQSDGGEL